MWQWSKAVAERAAAAVWADWRTRESEPTVLDPEDWRDGEEDAVSTLLRIAELCLVG